MNMINTNLLCSFNQLSLAGGGAFPVGSHPVPCTVGCGKAIADEVVTLIPVAEGGIEEDDADIVDDDGNIDVEDAVDPVMVELAEIVLLASVVVIFNWPATKDVNSKITIAGYKNK